MIIFPNEDDFIDIHELLNKHADRCEVDMLAGIECDEEDLENQRRLGDEDPIAILEIAVQWDDTEKIGIVDWAFARESALEQEEPEAEHGGALLAFRYHGKEPDFDKLLVHAVPRLNKEVRWANFETEEE